MLLPAKQSWRNSYKKGRFRNRHRQVPSFLPSAVTILALCLGLTALRMGLKEQWDFAIMAILSAAILDGLDGRLARFLGSASRFGAELDSLADLVNFGVVPSVVLYLRVFGAENDLGWIAVLFFCTCMALRLARFNIYEPLQWAKSFSIGVPAPAGAFLILTPLMGSLAYPQMSFWLKPSFVLLAMVCVGILMISRVPTFLLKNVRISFQWLIPAIIAAFAVASCIYAEPWTSLVMLSFCYILSIPLSIRLYGIRKKMNQSLPQNQNQGQNQE